MKSRRESQVVNNLGICTQTWQLASNLTHSRYDLSDSKILGEIVRKGGGGQPSVASCEVGTYSSNYYAVVKLYMRRMSN